MPRASDLPNQYSRSSMDRYNNLLQFADRQDAPAEWLTAYLTQLFQDQLDQGLISPEDIRAIGERIMPDVQRVIDTRNTRINNLRANMANIPRTEDVTGAISSELDALGRDISRTEDFTGGHIKEGFSAARGRGAAATKDVRDRIEALYRDLGIKTDTEFGKVRGSVGTSFDEALKNLENLRPGGEAAVARAARAFAPQLSATRARLIRSGIDPNSLEGDAAVGRVETGRSRAMQDEMADLSKLFVSEQNRLGLGKSTTDADLALQQLGITTGLAREGGGLTRDEIIRDLVSNQGMDLAEAEALVNNSNLAFNRTADWRNARMQLPLTGRALAEGDFGREGAMTQLELNNDLLEQELRNQQFNAGMSFNQADLARRDAGAAGLRDVANTRYNNMFRGLDTAMAFGDRGLQAGELARQLDERNSGWWKKLLGGLAVGAVGMIPGAGPFLSAGLGGALSGTQWGGGSVPQFGGSRPYSIPPPPGRTGTARMPDVPGSGLPNPAPPASPTFPGWGGESTASIFPRPTRRNTTNMVPSYLYA